MNANMNIDITEFSPIRDGGGNRMKARSAVRRAMNSRRTIPGWEKERGNQPIKCEQQLWDADNGAAPKVDISGD